MSSYVRPQVTGATVFFTVALAQRGSDLLVREVAELREAVRATRAERPFVIDAWVVLPDHLHAVWTLPAGDRDFGVRWGAIKARFVRAVREKGAVKRRPGCRPGFSPAVAELPTELPVIRSGRYAGLKPGLRHDKREAAVWQRRFWGEVRPEIVPLARFQHRTGGAPAAKPTTSGMRRTMPRMSDTAGGTRSGTGWSTRRRRGRIRPFTGTGVAAGRWWSSSVRARTLRLAGHHIVTYRKKRQPALSSPLARATSRNSRNIASPKLRPCPNDSR